MDEDVSRERQAIACRAIKSMYGKPEGEYGPTLFVSHHLEALEPEYWLKTVGVERPSPEQILDALAFVASWTDDGGDADNIFDFGLPGDVSDYFLSVRFEDDGRVQGVSMES